MNNENQSALWTKDELMELCVGLVKEGLEYSKVDFKSEFSLNNDQKKGELVKDISAIANTFDERNQNFGFIILGAKPGGLCYLDAVINEDKLQASLDDILKHYIDPFIHLHLYVFRDAIDKVWGLILIPPSRNLPHVVVKDIHKRYRGDIYVRRNTITDKALPGDYARFFRQHVEMETFELKQNLNVMQQQIAILTEKVARPQVERTVTINQNQQQAEVTTMRKGDLSFNDAIYSLFGSQKDIVKTGLRKELLNVYSLLQSDELSWAAYDQKDSAEKNIELIESRCENLWKGFAQLIAKDDKGYYEDELINGINYLAENFEPPSAVKYNDFGVALRFYPLVVLLYICFIVGVNKKRLNFLRRVLAIKLRGRTWFVIEDRVEYSLFRIRAGNKMFITLNPLYPGVMWCDGIASYLKGNLSKYLLPEDLLWDYEREFFRGEFVLALAPLNYLDHEKKHLNRPASGAYLYYPNAGYVISNFLKEEKDFIEKLFFRDLKELLKNYDDTVEGIVPFSCDASGFSRGAFKIVYPDSILL